MRTCYKPKRFKEENKHMKTAKRILAVVLSVVLAFGTFSLAVSAAPVGDPALGTADLGLNYYKITTDGEGHEVRTPLAKSGAALSTGDIVEVGVSIETDFYTGSVYTQIWYDKTVFSPCLAGVADTSTKMNNVFTSGYATLIDAADAPTALDVNESEWNYLQTLSASGGYTGLCNMNTLISSQFPATWKSGTTVLPAYENMNFVSIIFASNSTSLTGGYLINVPEAEYATFRLIVVADAGTTTSSTVCMPYDAVKQTLAQSSNKIYVSSYDAGYTSGQTAIGVGHCIDLEDATATFEINQAASTFSAKFFEQDGTTELTDLALSEIESGESITLPAGPVVEGYDFDYWTIGANTYNAGTSFEVTEDVEFVAHYTEKTVCTVSFVSNNTSYGTITGTSSVQVYEGTAWNDAWYPSYSAVAGYKFDNWTGAVATVTGNVTVTANFSYDASQWATISFESGANGTIDAIAPQTVLKGTAWSEITVPATHPNVNYAFDAWTPALPAASDTINADATYTASFKSTQASYAIEIYTMNTSGTYGISSETQSGTIGETVSVDPASYVTPGFEVNDELTVSSATLAASGTVLKVYLDRVTVYYTYKYYDYAANDGTYTQWQQDAYLYGQTVTLPATTPDATAYDKEFEAWHVGSVEGPVFTGGTASANTDIYASFTDINTELDYTPITDAIATLPTSMNLYYYTDEAIIMVAAALNQTITAGEIAAFLAAPYAYKNMTSSFASQAQVQAAADNIGTVLSTINSSTGSGYTYNMPYRDESKAISKFFVTPDVTSVQADDIVTFTVSAYTSFLTTSMLMGIVYDADKFDFVSIYDDVYTKTELGTAYPEEAIEVTASTTLKRNYDVECLSVDSPAVKYPTSYQTPEYMSQYKIILGSVSRKGAANTVVSSFGSSITSPSELFTFRLKAKSSAVYDGTTSTVGFVQDWFPTNLGEVGNSISTVRGGHTKDIGSYDLAAQYGQTFTADNATLTFGAPAKTLSSVEVNTMPTKTSYFVGDLLDATGLTLTATYDDSSTETITSGFTCDPTALNTAGTQTITVTYEGKTCTFDVDVEAVVLSSVEVKTMPTKTSYFVGDTLDAAGLELTATYNNGTTETITSGFTCDPTALDMAGTQTITVTYEGKTCTFDVSVSAIVLSSIEIKTMPTITSYFVGDTLDETGLELTATYNNDYTETILSGFTCDPTTLGTAGTQTITVTYDGKTCTFDVDVVAVVLDSIAVKTVPTKTSYFVGDTLDTAGLELTATYNNGTTETITSGFTCDPTALDTAGTQTITVTYDGKTCTFDVSVEAVVLSSVAVKTMPTKTSYFVGDTLDETGLELTSTYNNGTTETITSGFTCDPTALNTAGTQTITVTYEGKTCTFDVDVEAIALSSVAVKTMPTKTNYYVNDTLDATGLELTATYNNGTTETITSGFTCDPTIIGMAGTQTITVTYEGKTCTFDVNVATIALSSIVVKTMPTITSYFVGDTLDTAGLELTVNYNNGETATITSGFTCDPTTLDTEGTQTITVTFGGKTCTFDVDVVAVVLDSISVNTMPTKTSYFVGDTLDTAGLDLTATYNNGTTETITSGFTCDPTILGTAGTQTITVTYDGKTCTFDVNVVAVVLDSIAVKTMPTKTSYFVGDTLDETGLELTATYNNGTTETIISGFTCDPTALNTAGTQTITVTYEGKTCTFDVDVEAVVLESVAVKTMPAKTSYFVGDTLDETGLELTATYNNGTTATITSGFTCDPTTLGTAGTQTITVTYEGKTCTFDVTVSINTEISLVLWSALGDIEDTATGYTFTEDDDYIYIIAQKVNGNGPVKVQLRLNGSIFSTYTFTRNAADIEDVELYGASCELWKLAKNRIADGTYIVIAKYIMSQSINDIDNSTGYEMIIDTYVEPVYYGEVHAAVVEGLDANNSMYFSAEGLTMKFYTSLDVYKIQLLDNVTLGTLTYTENNANVSVVRGTYEGEDCLVWTINKVFGISSYNFSVFARSPLGMLDSEIDLEFSIKVKPAIPSQNAFVSVAIDDDTINIGDQSVITVVTCKSATKVQFVSAGNASMTFSKNSAGVTWQENGDTATWTITRTFAALGNFTWSVRVFDNGAYTETYADKLVYTVSRPEISKFISISIDDNGQPILPGFESTITVVTHASAEKVVLVDSITGATWTLSKSSLAVTDVVVDNQAGTATWIIKKVFAIGNYSFDVKVFAQGSYSDIVENALQFSVLSQILN